MSFYPTGFFDEGLPGNPSGRKSPESARPVTKEPATEHAWRPENDADIAVEGDMFRDRHGRTVTLRGVHAVEGWNEGPFHPGAFEIYRHG